MNTQYADEILDHLDFEFQEYVSAKPEYDIQGRINKITYYLSNTQTNPNRLAEATVTYTGDNATQEQWKYFEDDGVTIFRTETTTYTWTGDNITNFQKVIT
jgi:hypothetical protein